MDETTPDNIRKVPASAGAQWLIDGFALLKASPGGFGVMGVLYGVFAAVMAGIVLLLPPAGFVVQTVWYLVAPILTAGLVWAAHEVAAGRHVGVATYFEPFRQEKVPSLLATLLPQLAGAVLIVALAFVLIGADNMRTMVAMFEKMREPGAQPDPALLASLPAGGVLLWMLCSVVIGIAVFFITFVAIPAIMLGGKNVAAALRDSWRACLNNLLAIVVLIVLIAIMFVGIAMLAGILGVIIGLVAGQLAQALVVQFTMMAVFAPVMAAAAVSAWRSMLGQEAVPPALPTGQLQA
ncbi:BPSS1780 family membrane protein [Solilutibacter silvestris]|uniref:BPSS1780 family membrane protein n=1 Tax=Solilutibacter silvestris TaxID=1645665 RepID=UPI003D329DF6